MNESGRNWTFRILDNNTIRLANKRQIERLVAPLSEDHAARLALPAAYGYALLKAIEEVGVDSVLGSIKEAKKQLNLVAGRFLSDSPNYGADFLVPRGQMGNNQSVCSWFTFKGPTYTT